MEPIALTAIEVAQLLQCSRRTVQLMAKRNEIPHQRIGKLLRFHQGEVETWLKSGFGRVSD